MNAGGQMCLINAGSLSESLAADGLVICAFVQVVPPFSSVAVDAPFANSLETELTVYTEIIARG